MKRRNPLTREKNLLTPLLVETYTGERIGRVAQSLVECGEIQSRENWVKDDGEELREVTFREVRIKGE